MNLIHILWIYIYIYMCAYAYRKKKPQDYDLKRFIPKTCFFFILLAYINSATLRMELSLFNVSLDFEGDNYNLLPENAGIFIPLRNVSCKKNPHPASPRKSKSTIPCQCLINSRKDSFTCIARVFQMNRFVWLGLKDLQCKCRYISLSPKIIIT